MLSGSSLLLGIGLFLLGYVFGSLPNGLWLVKAFYKIDIRDYGSKNIGSTNVFRTVGAKPAACVLVLDILKGVIPFDAGCQIFKWRFRVLCIIL
jgi:glycerol-3-phosphate acyltransferase PlsY